MINNYALINKATHRVERIVYWDGESELLINDYPGQLIGKYDLILIDNQEVGTWFYFEETETWSLVYRTGEVPPINFIWDGTRFTNPAPQPDIQPTNSSTSGTIPF